MTKFYVDALLNWPGNTHWRYGKSCHLMVDPGTPIEELHRFAEQIGMKQQWFQVSASGVPHYDLTEKRRKAAVTAGAIEINRRKAVEIIRGYRHERQGS